MHEVFADAAAMSADFAQTLAWWSAFVVIGVAVLWLADRGRPSALTLRASASLGAVLLGAISLAVYSNTVANFAAITVHGNVVSLAYPAPYARTVAIPAQEVQHVLVGLPGKRSYPTTQCYIKLVLRSGDSHRSAAREQTLESCKQLRIVIERTLDQRKDGT